MKGTGNRKLPRFFIVNPIRDRRLECRFESKEDVDVRMEETGNVFPAVAFEVGRRGMRLETAMEIPLGSYVQVAFRENSENIRCFGQIAWSGPKEEGNQYACGISVESWHGIVKGEDSYQRYKGFKLKRERRRKAR